MARTGHSIGTSDGSAMVELGMVLDFLDALAGAVAIGCWWCTWVSPGKPAQRLRSKADRSGPPEIDRFLEEARRRPGPRRLCP